MQGYELILNNSVFLDGIGEIYFPTVNDLIIFKEEKLNELIYPFKLTLEAFGVNDDTLNIFDVYEADYKMDRKYFDLLIQGLEYFFKCLAVYDEQNQIIRIGQNGVINRDNFDKLCDVILEISCDKRVEVEKIPEFQNEAQRDVYMKVMEGRRRKSLKNALSYGTIINVVMHGGRSYIPSYEIKKMTLYGLINSYRAILGMDEFEINFRRWLAGDDPKKSKLDLTYWSEKLKL